MNEYEQANLVRDAESWRALQRNVKVWLCEADGFRAFTRSKVIADRWTKAGLKVTELCECS